MQKECKNVHKIAVFGHFGHFWPFWPFFCHFWAVLGRFWRKEMSEIMSSTCLSWHTTGATFHYAKRVQKCAQNGHFWWFWPFFGHFWPFLTNKNVENHVIYLSFMAHYWGNLSLCKKSAEMCTKWPFLVIFAIFGRFWPFLAVFEKKMSEIMLYTCLPWPTTGATLHSVRIMQKCAQNVQKCAKKSFFGQILAKKRIFDAPKFFFLLFSFQKWIPLEKLDIKHVLYDFLHATTIMK